MKNKVILLILMMSMIMLGRTYHALAQQTEKAEAFQGATADKAEYKAVFELNKSADKIIRGTLRNMKHVLEDPRINGKVKLELVAHSGGIAALLKKNDYGKLLKQLYDRGVMIAACHNTMKGKGISKEELLPFVSVVPSGVGELIIRQQQGWAVIHP